MNHLAHIYLSGPRDHIKIGNFIGDYVKGKQYLDYPEDIKKGILLHRHIDDYTDNSKIPKRLRKLLKPTYKRYSGIITDLFYDHFLANNWNYFSTVPLEEFVDNFYKLLDKNFDMLPEEVQNFLPYMIAHNRLLSYRDIEGIKRALKVMVNNTSLPDKTENAIDILKDHYNLFNDNFLEFFPYLIRYVKKHFAIELQYSFNSQY